jgi:hypothetical protein
MKKQKQNLSASIVQPEPNLLSPDRKRDRDETLEELEKIPIKKQKIEKPNEAALQDKPASNFSNTCSKYQLTQILKIFSQLITFIKISLR